MNSVQDDVGTTAPNTAANEATRPSGSRDVASPMNAPDSVGADDGVGFGASLLSDAPRAAGYRRSLFRR